MEHPIAQQMEHDRSCRSEQGHTSHSRWLHDASTRWSKKKMFRAKKSRRASQMQMLLDDDEAAAIQQLGAPFPQLVDNGEMADGAPPVPPRPRTAVGTFLRIVTVNDVYKLENYPSFKFAIQQLRDASKELDCVVTSHRNGDFLSPCILTALDGGRAMMEALNHATVDYACFGNHEFDIGFGPLKQKLELFEGSLINSNCRNPEYSHLPTFATLAVGSRTVVLGGFVTDDMEKYAPANRPDLTSVSASALEVWERAKAELGTTPDLFLPMTHQFTKDDRAFAETLADHKELAACTPVILAGHDHEVFVDEAGRSLICKVGADAEQVLSRSNQRTALLAHHRHLSAAC
jgi:hypothetical protein